jgi:hypothetical protein
VEGMRDTHTAAFSSSTQRSQKAKATASTIEMTSGAMTAAEPQPVAPPPVTA